MKHILLSTLLSTVALAGNNEFIEGCEKASTELMCKGFGPDCKMATLMGASKKGNDFAKAGEEECTAFAKEVMKIGISLEEKRAITAMKGQLAAMNKELAKDFPFIKLTADFDRLTLETLYLNARHMDHYNTRERPAHSEWAGMANADSKRGFQQRYLNVIKSTLYNIAKDDDGKEALKAKVKEIRFTFTTGGRTADNGTYSSLKNVDGVIQVGGIYMVESSDVPGAVQQFIEKDL